MFQMIQICRKRNRNESLCIEIENIHFTKTIYIVAEVHSLNQYSKGKRVYYGYSYG